MSGLTSGRNTRNPQQGGREIAPNEIRRGSDVAYADRPSSHFDVPWSTKERTPWENAGMSWAEWNEKTRPTLGSLGIDPGEWKTFQKSFPDLAKGTPGVSRGEENPGLIEAFRKWKAQKDENEENRGEYLKIMAESPGTPKASLIGGAVSGQQSLIGG